jgi:hypothetical protein
MNTMDACDEIENTKSLFIINIYTDSSQPYLNEACMTEHIV